jgi:ATP-dependent Lhr-like helicase
VIFPQPGPAPDPNWEAAAREYFSAWYASRSWQAFPFQLDMLEAVLSGCSGLLNAPTGSGKTYAAWIPLLCRHMALKRAGTVGDEGLKVLWITPLRALAKDITRALQEACEAYDMPWQVQRRTGDTEVSTKQAQFRRMPQALVTTPESLHLLLARKGYPRLLSGLQAVVVDEWHELLGSKRGVQVELGLSRLRHLNPDLMVWGISATIGNLVQAAEVLLGNEVQEERVALVRSQHERPLRMHTVLPDDLEAIAWGGHLGTRMLGQTRALLDLPGTTLLFTNTRAQSEIWYQKLLDADPELAGQMALHHGSLDRELREWVEEALGEGSLKAVVCTSSLDLGVDFRPVDQVVQIGGPKGVARFVQRAGRSGHRPGALPSIHFLPTYALELLEAAALREALSRGYVEKRIPLRNCFDVLVQYLVTLALSEGFRAEELLPEIRSTHCFADLSDDEWRWCLQFITSGGPSLHRYDEFKRVTWEDGVFRVRSRSVALRHRLHIGTIASEAMLKVRFQGGAYLGSVEEYFISRLKPGNSFWFAGRMLELIQVREMEVLVRKSRRKTGAIPQWAGGRMSFSSGLSTLLREELDRVLEGRVDKEELRALEPLFDLQKKRSVLPDSQTLLVELLESEDGHHVFLFPFEGRQVHEALAGLLIWRMSRIRPGTYSMAMNDFGLELLCDQPVPIREAIEAGALLPGDLPYDLLQSVNAAEMAQRKFRDIATIAGLTFPGYPGRLKRAKHLQASAGLIYRVLADYDPENLLLRQAVAEVLDQQMEEARMRSALMRMSRQRQVFVETARPSPLAFPILVERFRERMSTETLAERIRRMQLDA